MKIIIPILGFGKAGGFKTLSKLANCWVRKGHCVLFLSARHGDPYYATSADIIYLNSNSALKKIFNLLKIKVIYDLFLLRKAINEYSQTTDIVLASYSLTAFPVFFSKKSSKKFYYVQAYEPEFFNVGVFGKLKSKIISFTYHLKLQIIVNSPIYFRYKNLASNYCVFPGMDLNLYNAEGKTYIVNFDENRPLRLGCIGRVEKWKGTSFVVSAFNMLKIAGINCELHMVTFGNKALLENVNRIDVWTVNKESDLAEFYKFVDVLITPGTIQFGAVHYPVVEAMACGTPLVTTNYHPAHPDNSWIVYPESVESIVNAVKYIYLNPTKAYEKAQKAIHDVKHLSWDIVSNEMLRIFSEEA